MLCTLAPRPASRVEPLPRVVPFDCQGCLACRTCAERLAPAIFLELKVQPCAYARVHICIWTCAGHEVYSLVESSLVYSLVQSSLQGCKATRLQVIPSPPWSPHQSIFVRRAPPRIEHMNMYTGICTYTCIFLRTYIRIYVYMHICMYMYVCICV